ncbi:MAG: hypothetical protein ACREPM_09345 [Gemmatimonadaceae bacterium]
MLRAASLLIIAASASPLLSQSPVQTVFSACPVTSHVFTEREVQVAAKPIGDSSRSPRPIIGRSTDSNTIAFVVDTLGVPETASLVRVHLADTLLWTRVERAYRDWRFEPAMASGCKVRQRVVAAIKQE